ncbi:MAG: hypothetical protein IJ941_02155, partial [Clostridia bacterium]|nr:hypothetical protein [Clostridia bacterium]
MLADDGMHYRCFQQTHVIGNDDNRFAVAVAKMFQSAQMNLAADAFDQEDIFAGKPDLGIAVEFAAASGKAGTDKYSEIIQVKVPAAAEHKLVKPAYRHSVRSIIPKHPPFDYYTKEFKKGLRLYTNGVVIMDKCEELLPDHFSFVKGLVDSADLTLNISRETLQHDHLLKIIAKNLEKKIKSELE